MLNRWEDNNFNLLRVLAALAVLLCHGEFLYRLSLPVPFAGHSLGAVGVNMFFFISGYLVTLSWQRSGDAVDFTLRRLARIFPGLLAASLLSVALIGAWMTRHTPAAYWSEPDTWLYFLSNAFGMAQVQVLPGVFENLPFARAVNGSLWTIRYELLMYGLLLLVSRLGAQRIPCLYEGSALALALLWWMQRHTAWFDPAAQAMPLWLGELWSLGHVSTLGVYFFIGCAFAQHRPRSLSLLGLLGLMSLTLARLSSQADLIQLWLWAGIPCTTFWLAHLGTRWLRGRPFNDISYGLYIYAFPIQQMVTHISLSQGWSLTTCLSLSLLLTTVVATASWFTLEKPCMQWTRLALQQRHLRKTWAKGNPAGPHQPAPARRSLGWQN